VGLRQRRLERRRTTQVVDRFVVPLLSQAHYRLALVYQRTGRKDLAARELETFRQLTAASGGDKQ
jgi:hypothetical protein